MTAFGAGVRVRGLNAPARSSTQASTGALAAASAFFIWGIVPLYWKQMTAVSAPELIAHRIVWSLVFLLGVTAWQRNFAALRPGLATPRAFGRNLLAGVLLTLNWGVYVWAVNAGHVIETSLGAGGTFIYPSPDRNSFFLALRDTRTFADATSERRDLILDLLRRPQQRHRLESPQALLDIDVDLRLPETVSSIV